MSTGARLGAAPPWGGSSLRGTVQDEALVGAGDRASGPWGLGVAAEGGGGERGSPLGRAWVPGGSGLQVPGGPDHGRLSSSCREDGAGKYQSSSQQSRPVAGRPRGETATQPRDARAAAASQPPCTLSSRLACGAERNWHLGTSESATSETRTTSRKPPCPIISALPHGVQTRAQRQPPWTTRPLPPRRPCPGSGAHGPSRRSISHGPSHRIAHGAILAAV